jgi:hypothetical protein
MPTQPLYVETEEEIPEVIERLRRAPTAEVPLVLPNHSRLGQSRFNFQLLSHYGQQMGKRISIISPDPAVQQMAEENGFRAYPAVDQYGITAPVVDEASVAAPVAAAPAAGPPPALITRVAKQAHARLPSKVITRPRPGRAVLYVGLAMLAIVGMACGVLFVPSATVILSAPAKPFSLQSEVQAEPGKAPVRVRTVSVQKQASGGYQTTGTKVTPGDVATGTIAYHNNCPVDLFIRVGQSLTSSNGLEFRQTGGTDVDGGATGVRVPSKSSRSASIKAADLGERFNVEAGLINGMPGNDSFRCLTLDNPSALSGGKDEKKENQMSTTDFETARSALQQQLQKEITDELTKQTQQGEKLAEAVQFEAPDYHTDHAPNDVIKSFGATMTLKGEGAFYFGDDVTRAFGDNLAKKVPPDQVLTDNKVKADYRLDHATPGGHLFFTGTASSYVAPKLDQAKIKSKLVGRSTGAAKTDLEKLPGQPKVDIKENPFRLPFMPLLDSRIKLTYVVEQGATPSPSPGASPGASASPKQP